MDQARLAVLIDADNIVAAVADRLLREVALLGTLCTVRVYGDWNSERLKKWKEPIQRHGMLAVQQFSHARGKNSTDIALVIDAMDLLHEANMDAFCLVSSDSDFTRLAQRIRSSGRLAYGFGGTKASLIFKAACSRYFVMDEWGVEREADATPAVMNTEMLQPPEHPVEVTVVAALAVPKPKNAAPIPPLSARLRQEAAADAKVAKPLTTKAATPSKAGKKPAAKLVRKTSAAQPAKLKMDDRLKAQLRAAFHGCKNAQGQASENAMQAYLGKAIGDFKSARPFGYSSMSALLTASKEFDQVVIKGTPDRKRDHQVSLRAKTA